MGKTVNKNNNTKRHSSGKNETQNHSRHEESDEIKFNMSQSSAHRCIVEALSAFCKMVPSFVSWPTVCEKIASSAAFNTKCGIQSIIGAIDGCHIKIQRPHTRGGDCLNRKNYYPERCMMHEFWGNRLFLKNWNEKMGRFLLLGDSAYIGQAYPFIKTPKRDNGALTMQDQVKKSKISREWAWKPLL